MAAASASSSPGREQQAVHPVLDQPALPGMSEATTGRPAAIASSRALDSPSAKRGQDEDIAGCQPRFGVGDRADEIDL